MATPILKWAGGKRQLLSEIDNLLALDIKNGTIKKYAEPFFGGGAVFFHLIEKYNIEKSYISDLNIELILLYKVVQNHVEDLIIELQTISNKFFNCKDEDERSELYYQVRKDFNKNVNTFDLEILNDMHIKRASEIIFLNKTCFNGLFRVNKKGEFNVPFSKPKNPKILDEDNLFKVSQSLKNTKIEHTSYEKIPKEFLEDTFIYFDPPYRPLNISSSFTSYSKYDFDDTHQIELAQYFQKISKNSNLFIMLSNSDPKNIDEQDDFFDNLYKDFYINRVWATRMINSKSAKRGKVSELIIKNYKTEIL